MIGAMLSKRAARAVYEAINRRDLDTLLQAMAEEVVFDFPLEPGEEGHHVGKPSVAQWFQTFFDDYPEIAFTLRHVSVEDIFALGGTNTVHAEWDLAYADRDGKRFQNRGVTAIGFRGGRIVRLRDYIFEQLGLVGASGAAG
jgi:ketosteroid isomerase-like protein